MPIRLTTDKGKTVYVTDKPFNSGGQGGVYRFVGARQNLVAKIFYHETPEKLKKAKKLEPRIRFMVNNSPIKNSSLSIRNALIWPTELLYRNNDFVGFTMPIAGDTKLNEVPVKLTCLSKLELSQSIRGLGKWEKFKRNKTNSLKTRLQLCYNIARAVGTLHDTGSYILVDFKPDNVLINSNGWMSIIDLDSIQISKNRGLLFGAEAFTEEYVPPEYQKNLSAISKSKKNESWDRFCYGVLAYQLLLGIHPFTASHHKFHATTEFIREGLFPNGKQKNKFQSIPPPHRSFAALPKEIQALFITCFEVGHQNPTMRPTLKEWSDTIVAILQRPPKIHWFKANKPVRDNQDPIRLSWQVENAGKIFLNGKSIKNKGFVDVTPMMDTVYTLEVRNEKKSVTSRLTVRIDKRPPRILFFKSDKSLLTDHLPATLSWDTERTQKVEISTIGNVSGKNSCKVSPKRDMIYRITAMGYFGQVVEERLTLKTSKKPPNIKSFKSNIAHRVDESKVYLDWIVDGAYSLYIDGIGDVSKRKRIVVDPRQDTVYQLKARSYFGVESNELLKITVSKSPPVIELFDAAPQVRIDQNPIMLRWRVKNAEKVTLLPNGEDLGTNDSKAVFPLRDLSYTLRSQTLFGVLATKSISVTVSKVPPEIRTFRFHKSMVKDQEEALLSWEVKDANKVWIDQKQIKNHKGTMRVKVQKELPCHLKAESLFGVVATEVAQIYVLKRPEMIRYKYPLRIKN